MKIKTSVLKKTFEVILKKHQLFTKGLPKVSTKLSLLSIS